MAHDYLARPENEVRRHDRAVFDEAWMKDFITKAPYGVLALSHEGHPFVNTNLFYYDEGRHAIYLHTARVGRTKAFFDHYTDPQPTCFSTFEMGRLLPADEALEFSVEYAGVTAFGPGQVVTDDEEATIALQGLLDKYAPHLRPGEDYRPTTPEELARTAVFRVDIESWSGKKKEVEDDFPGAFWYAGDSAQ